MPQLRHRHDRFFRAQTVPKGAAGMGLRRRLNKLNLVPPPVQTVLLGALGRHERPSGSQAITVVSCARRSFQPDPSRLCETLYTHFSPRRALKRGTAVVQ
jgi:hypothetical protein